MMKEIEKLISNTARPGPSFFQLHFFVVGKEPTNQAKMHTCLEEIKQRYNAIKSVELELEETNDVIALYEIDVKRVDKKYHAEEREIRTRQIKRKITSAQSHIETLKEKIHAWEEEIAFLKDLYDKIAKKVPLKSWDDFDVQLEYWSEKMSQEIRQRLIMNAPIDMEIIKTALSLPDSAPIKQQLIEYVREQEKKLLVDK